MARGAAKEADGSVVGLTIAMPTVTELRSELGKRKLPTDGHKADLEQRLSAVESQESQRVKIAMNSIADEWVCPITQELPIDPVMAEDGKIYERAAIARWLGDHQRSPSTGKAMGTKLIASPQVRNTLEHLVQSGVIDGDKAVAWKEKLRHEQEMNRLRTAADQGDAGAMYRLGRFYKNGKASFEKDHVQARVWYKRAGELDHVKGMATFGEYLLKGLGGPSIPALGLVYTTRAAEAGSDLATYLLGLAFMRGHYGLPQDSARAKRYLRKVAEGECEHNNLKEASREQAKQFLQEQS